jgi:IS5 family transposase
VTIGDRGYRGKTQVSDRLIHTPKPLPSAPTKYQKQKARKRCRSRAGIEPVIGHLKHNHRMIRNYLKGELEDKVNTILAGTAFNLKKMLLRIKASTKNTLSQFFERLFYVLADTIFLPKMQLLKKSTF